MTLFVHRATSPEVLVDGLADLLATPLADPFAEEVVAVPAKGVERWLAQRLSHRLGAADGHTDGVCAGIRFLNPHSLVALVLGIETGDPWHPEQLAWPVLRAVDESLDEPWAATLATHLGHGLGGIEGELGRARRYAVARRLAGLFAEYALQRPAMLADWLSGGSGDGVSTGTIDADLGWQPELWRRVVAVVREADASILPPEQRQAAVVDALRSGDLADLDLPGRLSLFGHTRIARSEIEVITALAAHRDVHLWLPQASPAAWDRLTSVTAEGPVPRDRDESGLLIEHPLLASLGRDARELQRTLALAQGEDFALTAAAQPPQSPSLLHLLQRDVAADRPASDTEIAAREIPAADRSIQIHACHGQARQVEVLRDVIADLLEQDPTLEPRDILVMCPDIETYAPLFHAAFGLAGAVRDSAPESSAVHPAHSFRVRIADRAPLHTNPLLALADRLVMLAGGRLTASEVLDLARSAPVSRRFGFDDDDLDRLSDWVSAVAIRWGLDANHREMYLLRDLPQNTWETGLDRILIGAAVDGQDVDHVGTTLALDDLDSGDIELAGRFAELVARLAASFEAMRAAVTAQDWVPVLRDAVLGLADVTSREAWQIAQFEHEVARLGAAAAAVGGAELGLPDIHALLEGRGAGRATRSNFRTGTLTVCTMVPMRSVPHKVVALVGLDDGAFPRTTTPDGDDALARRPVTGERDLRSEDRQLLLDALMSAGQTLIVTYAGFDEHSGHERPPAVPLGELIDTVRRTGSGPGVERLVTSHPLQPFDARNLGAGGASTGTPRSTPLLPGDRPFSYDPTALDAAREASGARTTRIHPVDVSLAPAASDDVDVSDLIRFFDHPARAFLRTRLGMVLPEVPEESHEGIPIELDGLETWAIGERVLQAILAGRDLEATCDAELWRGELPPDALGHRVLHDIAVEVKALTAMAWRVAGMGKPGVALPREVVDIDVSLPSGRRLVGTVPGLIDQQVMTVTYSSARAKQRLRSWITSLALSATGSPATSHVIGREKRWNKRGQVHIAHGPHEPQVAAALLDDLIDLRDRGLSEPIPLPLQTAHAWAECYLSRQGDQREAFFKASKAWHTDDGGFAGGLVFEKEDRDPAHQFVYGGVVSLREILGEAREDEVWEAGLRHRLGQCALRLWRPLLDDGPERMERS